VTKVISFKFEPTYHRIMTLSSHSEDTRTELAYTPFDLVKSAQEFAAEVAGTAERKKKTISAPVGIQVFLLYVRAHGNVPIHKGQGAITVQTILGHATLIAGAASHDLPKGSMVCVAAGAPHQVLAGPETVLVVTQALQV
jgi:quercetin dioxygenase-like cupin family protein